MTERAPIDTTRRCGRFAAGVALACVLVGCGRLSDDRAILLVRTYNQRVIEAYRAGDARLIEGITGSAEAKKLTGLIGVKLDMGFTLDARLDELVVVGVKRSGDAVFVHTRERWYYADRRIGSGDVVGSASVDRYEMEYRLARDGDRWVVERIRFATPPLVGRKSGPTSAPASVMHGITTTPIPGVPSSRSSHP